MNKATCKMCGKTYQMVHNEDMRNLEEIESIETTGLCLNCSQE